MLKNPSCCETFHDISPFLQELTGCPTKDDHKIKLSAVSVVLMTPWTVPVAIRQAIANPGSENAGHALTASAITTVI
jgi:hypothetical protein